MQQLHLVGLTTDLGGLILSSRRGTKSGGYVIPLDDNLLGVLEDALRRRDGDAGDDPQPGTKSRKRTRQQSALTPREIQAKLRAGRSMTAVANEAGVTEDWVLRFAIPILAEQSQMVTRAKSLHFSTPRRGPSSQPLGTSVLWNLVDRGVVLDDGEFDRCWTAFQARNGSWVIRFTYVSRKRQQRAEWEFDPQEQLLLPINRLAAELGYVEPGRRLRKVPRPDPPASGTTGKQAGRGGGSSAGRPSKRASATFLARLEEKKAPAKRSTRPSKKSAAKKTAARKSAAKKATAKKATAKKAVPRKTTARKATPERTTARKATPKKAAPRKAAARKATPKKATPRRAPAPPATHSTPPPAPRAVPRPARPARPARPLTPPARGRPLVAAAKEPEPAHGWDDPVHEPAPVAAAVHPGATEPAPQPEQGPEPERPTVVIRTNQAGATGSQVAAFPRPQSQVSELPVLERPRPKRIFRRRARGQ